ncbi:unnamed protein product [Brassica oleracea]
MLCTWTVLMNDKTEDIDDDLDEDFHGDDMPASDCNVDEFDYFVIIDALKKKLQSIEYTCSQG